MARTHKYVKRTGTQGNYKYWYKMPDGTIRAADSGTDEHKAGLADHARRLIAGRWHGHHDMTPEKIARELGISTKRVREHITNMRSKGKRKNGDNPLPEGAEVGTHGHEYTEHHMREAHVPTDHPDYHAHAARAETSGSTAARTPARRSRGVRRGRSLEPDGPAAAPAAPAAAAPAAEAARGASSDAEARKRELRERLKRVHGLSLGAGEEVDPPASAPAAAPASAAPSAPAPAAPAEAVRPARRSRGVARGRSLEPDGPVERTRGIFVSTPGVPDKEELKDHAVSSLGRLKTTFSAVRAEAIKVHADGTVEREYRAYGYFTDRPGEEDDDNPTFHPEEVLNAVREDLGPFAEHYDIRTFDHEKSWFTVSLKPKATTPARAAAPTPARPARESAARARRAAHPSDSSPASPSAPHAAELAEVNPAFAADEAPIREAIALQASGGNPYLEKAKEVFARIKPHLPEPRKGAANNFLSAVMTAARRGELNDAKIKSIYNDEFRNGGPAYSEAKKHFEASTFHDLTEITSNTPIDPTIERMKRGYGAKQFARMKPFIKPTWLAANPSAPPPYPTFGDVKTWTEHGGGKPTWAGTTRLAMPKEVFDAAPKGPDGKPKYPPAWMPIHLAPVWGYVHKKQGDSAYQTAGKTLEQIGWQAPSGQQEGYVLNAMRRYIKARGGVSELVDIPSSKLAEAGLAHHDLFKAEKSGQIKDLTDSQIKELAKHKIFDVVELVPHLKAAMSEKPMKKSFALVIEQDASPVVFKKSFVLDDEDSIRKSRIAKIKRLLDAKRA